MQQWLDANGFHAGVVGIALAMAGATVTLADLPHINPLALQNVARNQLTDRCQVSISQTPTLTSLGFAAKILLLLVLHRMGLDHAECGWL